MNVYGIDQSDASKKNYPEINFKFCDLINEKIPFEDEFFDVIFSKSLVEHFLLQKKYSRK